MSQIWKVLLSKKYMKTFAAAGYLTDLELSGHVIIIDFAGLTTSLEILLKPVTYAIYTR